MTTVRTDVANPAAACVVTVNDDPRNVQPGSTVATLAVELGLGERKGVAVAVNGAVLPRVAWPSHVLSHGDSVLVIRATQGG